jgi:hypothetical protein
MSPSMRDSACDYSALQGSARNPLAMFGDSQVGGSLPRGAFESIKIVSNVPVVPSLVGTPAQAIVDVVLCEALMLSPFHWGSQDTDRQGFYNITQMDFSMSFLAGAGFRMWSHSDAAILVSGLNSIHSNITTITTQFNNFTPAFSFTGEAVPLLLCKYLSPNLLSSERMGPNIPQTYSYFDVNRYPSDIGIVPYGVSAMEYSTNSIQLSTIPKKLYVFARATNNTLQTRCDLSDSYLAIDGISIQFENQSNILSSASSRQLYLIDNKNQNKISYAEWSGKGVSVDNLANKVATSANPLSLDFGIDIPLGDPSLAPGVNGSFQLNCTVRLRNQNNSLKWDAVPMTLYMVIIQEGSMTIASAGQCQHQIGIISKQDVLSVRGSTGVSYRDAREGGDLWSSVKDIASNVNDFLKKTKIISTVGKAIPLPYASTIGNVADVLGYGMVRGGALVDREQLVSALAPESNGRRRLMDR